MEDQLCRQFFLAPRQTTQRRYEALRAVFIAGEPLAVAAQRFGYKFSALKSIACRFRADCRRGATPPFSSPMAGGEIPGRAATPARAGRNYPRWRTAAS